MSIWTDLLLLHGYVATPVALALVARTGTQTGVQAGARTASPGGPTTTAHRCISESASTAAAIVHHPLRVTGQIR